MQIKPLRNLVLVQRCQKATTSNGGIALPGTMIDENYWVDVLAVGPGYLKQDGTRMPMNAKVGAKMLLRQWCGLRLEPEKGFMSPLIIQDEQLEAYE